MEWIDSHVHVGEDKGGASNTVGATEGFFDEGVIDRAVVFCFNEEGGIPAGNESVRGVVEEDDRLVGLFRIDPEVHEPEDLAAADWPAGFKMHPRSQDFELEEMEDYFDVIRGTGKPVLIHTGIWREHTHPERVVEAVSGFTEMDIVLAHNLLGYYYNASREFKERLQGLEHIHLDLSIHVTPLGTGVLVEDLGPERLLFASDYPYGHPVPMRKNVELADITEDEMEKVAWRNAERLFF